MAIAAAVCPTAAVQTFRGRACAKYSVYAARKTEEAAWPCPAVGACLGKPSRVAAERGPTRASALSEEQDESWKSGTQAKKAAAAAGQGPQGPRQTPASPRFNKPAASPAQEQPQHLGASTSPAAFTTPASLSPLPALPTAAGKRPPLRQQLRAAAAEPAEPGAHDGMGPLVSKSRDFGLGPLYSPVRLLGKGVTGEVWLCRCAPASWAAHSSSAVSQRAACNSKLGGVAFSLPAALHCKHCSKGWKIFLVGGSGCLAVLPSPCCISFCTWQGSAPQQLASPPLPAGLCPTGGQAGGQAPDDMLRTPATPLLITSPPSHPLTSNRRTAGSGHDLELNCKRSPCPSEPQHTHAR